MNLQTKITISAIALYCSGCAVTVVEVLGIGAASDVASAGAVSTTALEIAQAIDTGKTIGDGVSYVGTGKTLTDHAISEYLDKDCKTFNLLEEKELCEEVQEQKGTNID